MEILEIITESCEAQKRKKIAFEKKFRKRMRQKLKDISKLTKGGTEL